MILLECLTGHVIGISSLNLGVSSMELEKLSGIKSIIAAKLIVRLFLIIQDKYLNLLFQCRKDISSSRCPFM